MWAATRGATEKGERAHMGTDPIRERLREGRFGIGEIGSAPHGDEEVGLFDFAGMGIDDGKTVGIIDEQAFAGLVVLAHDEVTSTQPATVEFAELRVFVAGGMVVFVFRPKLQEGQVKLLVIQKFLVDAGTIRPGTFGWRDGGRRRAEPFFQFLIREVRGQGIRDPRRFRAGQIIADSVAGQAQALSDFSDAEPDVVFEAKHFSDVSHG
jgi:hypothetical protein